ncbi:IclR family transcriptional regulator [Microbacterium sp. JB110]|uniref:IclR family transcriptional regulator n=1 Tax=unclassified Microbacterium TaxID=2609290 RepID=UPI00097F1B24|nr:IclR family transcriptional regulator C-terminal domain-containing protein [Microbacterium sp. JB110]SJM67131.1 Transcriptional regulator, IclR family [Frigoribacterium sp. JB110]
MTNPEHSMPEGDADAPLSVLDRVFAILEVVRRMTGPISVAGIAAEARVPRSTTARLIAELIEQRYLARDADGVTLGMRLFELGARATIPRRIAAAAAPVVHELAVRTGERVGVWVQQGTDMVSLTAVPGRLPMLPTRAGMRSPALTTASGKAFLAFCDDATVVERVGARLEPNDAERFHDELTTVRAATLATDPGDSYAGVLAVACPLMGHGRVVGALSLAGPADAMREERVAPLVRAAGVSLTRRLAAV